MPPLSVSNLAWGAADNGRVLNDLAALGVSGVEVAPTRIAPWSELSATKVRAYRASIEAVGLRVSSLQAIYFGVPDARLLADKPSFLAMSEHMHRVSEVAAILDAKVMVYGAPNTRKRGDLSPEVAHSLAKERCCVLGDIAKSFGLQIGIEPVPSTYGGDFLCTGSEVIEFLRNLGHPSVRLHLDTGCALLGGESIEDAILEGSEFLIHFHAAEPQLGDFSNPEAHHLNASKALRQCGYDQWIAIEMREKNLDKTAVATAIEYVRSIYQIDEQQRDCDVAPTFLRGKHAVL